MSAGPKVVILSASIGEGHDLPARVLAAGIAEADPVARVGIADFLAICSRPVRAMALGGASLGGDPRTRLFDLLYRLFSELGPTRRFTGWGLHRLIGGRMHRFLARADPDVVVSTYPGATELLGRMRESGELSVPVVSAITDLAALRFWVHPGVDLHLITHPESAMEVHNIAPAADVRCVRGLTDPRFYGPSEQAGSRRSLGLPEAGAIVVVSGGGWAVGDIGGAAEAVLEIPDATAVLLCGRNDGARRAMARRFGGDPRVRVLGFTEEMPELLGAADVLVHSTAGLTVLEALMRGCRVISFGWGEAHIRANNEAFVRFGVARVAADRRELAAELRGALAEGRAADRSFEGLPSAASAVLQLARPA